MKKKVFALGLLLFPAAAFAETIELVTYYPAPGGGNVTADRLHASRATIGNNYSLTNPAVLDPGILLVEDRIGVGVDAPLGPLHVVGRNDAVESVIFMPGADTAAADRPDIRVGVGTANPQALLDIQHPQDAAFARIQGAGDAENFSGLELRSDEATDKIWQIAHKRGGAGGLNDLQVSYRDAAGNWNPRLTIQPGGNVGIGVTNPGARLDVAQNTAIRVGDTYVSSGNAPPSRWAHFGMNAWFRGDQWIYTNPGQGISLVQLQNDSISLYTNANSTDAGWMNRLHIAANGRVGIGTTGPQQQLDVAGRIRFSEDGQNNGGLLWAGSPGNFGGREVVLTVRDGLGNDTDEIWLGCNTGAYRGHIQLNAAHTYVRGTEINPPSDGRLKTGIAPIPNALDRVAALKGINFHWKDPQWDKRLKMGLVAQQVEPVFPELVSTDSEGTKSVDYPMLTAALVEAVKELNARNEAQQRRIEEMERRLAR